MYKLIAIDLDGTMLNSYGEVSDNTKKVLKQKIQEGKEVVLASGRTTPSILPIAEEIGNINYIIAGNGALIYDIKNKQIIYNKFIPKQKVLEIINACEANSIFYTLYTENEIITKTLKYNVLYYHKENQKKSEEKQTKIKVIENIKQYVEKSQTNYLKIMICDESKYIFNGITNKLKNIKNIEVLDVGHQSRKIIREGTQEIPIEYYYTEVSLENVDKWEAIEYLIEKINIKPEDVIAIGDNVNDKKMIKNSGVGVAMGQSAQYVKEIADFITDSNDNEGVANFLETFLK
ncbi:MAG: HAD family phosphatase [Clostridia bacterium]|nr:HAD family phosphatase [Clostridia bacterium]